MNLTVACVELRGNGSGPAIKHLEYECLAQVLFEAIQGGHVATSLIIQRQKSSHVLRVACGVLKVKMSPCT